MIDELLNFLPNDLVNMVEDYHNPNKLLFDEVINEIKEIKENYKNYCHCYDQGGHLYRDKIFKDEMDIYHLTEFESLEGLNYILKVAIDERNRNLEHYDNRVKYCEDQIQKYHDIQRKLSQGEYVYNENFWKDYKLNMDTNQKCIGYFVIKKIDTRYNHDEEYNILEGLLKKRRKIERNGYMVTYPKKEDSSDYDEYPTEQDESDQDDTTESNQSDNSGD